MAEEDIDQPPADSIGSPAASAPGNATEPVRLMTRYRLATAVLMLLLMANLGGGVYVYSASEAGLSERQGFHAMQQFARVLKIIRYQYVDEGKVDYEHLLYGALNGMLGSLDRFSSFVPPEQFTSMSEETEGHFGGIGVILKMVGGKLTVVFPQEDTPGAKAGLLPEDQIIGIDGVPLGDGDLHTAIDKVKGPPGSVVKLTIHRPSNDTTFDVEMTRAIIQLPTVRKPKMLDDRVGYVELNQFGRQTYGELEEALDELAVKNMSGLILDLRNNPGGLLDSAVDIASLFLPENQLIVSTEGRNMSQRTEHYSSAGRKFVRMPMVILINEGSASAAEIVSGCLKDYGRATLIGEKSYGKGSVQNIISLDDGSAVRLTTAHYYTPKHYVIHEKGIGPNILVDISRDDAYRVMMQRSRLPGMPRDNGDPADIDDVQLQQAVKFITGLNALRPGDNVGLQDLMKSLEIHLPETAVDTGQPMP